MRRLAQKDLRHNRKPHVEILVLVLCRSDTEGDIFYKEIERHCLSTVINLRLSEMSCV